MLSLPLLMFIFDEKPKSVGVFENRHKAVKPELAKLHYTEWPQSIESYLTDNLGLRSQMISRYMKIWELLLGTNVRYFVKGTGGELYANFSQAPTVENYLGVNALEADTIQLMRLTVAGTEAYWKLHGARCLVAMAPDKTTLYPESLPPSLAKLENRSRASQVAAALSGTPLHFLNLATAMENYKTSNDLFNKKFDLVHWNGHGLEAAYKELCKTLGLNPFRSGMGEAGYAIVEKVKQVGDFGSEAVPWMSLLNRDNLEVTPNTYGGNSSLPWVGADLIHNKAGKSGKLLLLIDSYIKATHQDPIPGAHGNIFPLAHRYKDSLHMHYSQMNMHTMKRVVEEFKPDQVVYVFAERATPWAPTLVNQNEPYLLFLGDIYLRSRGLILSSKERVVEAITDSNCRTTVSGNRVMVTSATNYPWLQLTSTTTDENGRVTVLARVQLQSEATVRLFFAQKEEFFSPERSVVQKLKAGINDLHLSPKGSAIEPMRLRLEFVVASGIVTFLPIEEVDQLRRVSRGL